MPKTFNIQSIKILLIFSIAFLIFISSCDDADNGGGSLLTPAYLLPDDDEISGWKILGAYEEANDYDSLYALINGGAEIFIDNGFISSVFQIYQRCVDGVCLGALLNLRIYDQANETNAKTTYDKVSTGISIPWKGAGTEARIDESGLASYMVEFWQRNFFVQVIIEEKSDDSLNIVKLFASHIASKIR